MLQEPAVSKNIRFLCRDRQVAEPVLSVAAQLYYQYVTSIWAKEVWSKQEEETLEEGNEQSVNMALSSPTALIQQALYAQFVTRWAFLNFAKSPDLPLLFLLSSTFTYGDTRVLEAPDPRDYVFALPGLAIDSSQLGLYPDYSKSETSVFIELAQALIQHGHLIVLSWCRTKGERGKLPSWVPDFSHKIHRPLQWVEQVTGTTLVSPQPRFAASLGLQAPNGSKPLRLAPGRTLQIHGTSFDTIACSCASFSEIYERSSYGPERVARACVRLLKEMRLLLEEHQSFTADRATPLRTQAVWRTSVADTEMTQSWNKARRSENFGVLYKRLYSDNFPSEDMLEEESLKEGTLHRDGLGEYWTTAIHPCKGVFRTRSRASGSRR